jgi:hypothetical protein
MYLTTDGWMTTGHVQELAVQPNRLASWCNSLRQETRENPPPMHGYWLE